MTTRIATTTLLLGMLLALAPAASAQQNVTPDTDVETEKRAQTGMKFLSMSVDPRAAALGGAVTADIYGSSASLFYNPASMAQMPGDFHAKAGVMAFITDINYNNASIAYRPAGGSYGVVGLSFVSVDYGDFMGTVRANNEQGFVETGNYSPSAFAVGLGYARAFTDRFSAGAQVKYAFQDIGDDFITDQDFDSGAVESTESYSKGTVAVDFGIVYATGFESLVIAMSARNFAQELTYVRERFELPLTFQIGAAMNLMDLTSLNPEMHQLNLHLDAQRPRDFDEHIRFGLEYGFMDMVFLRGGFEQLGVSEEQGVSFGAGLQVGLQGFAFGADYAYTDFGLFGNVNRIALQVGF
ncbi:MAG: PorV/PorQ family protein [Rhodothermales bacterium]|nr:PorV/PorQ family protein [Rhodothermales bacterium]